MKTIHVIYLLGILLSACNKPSTIEVVNNIPEAVLNNIKWGDVPLATDLQPGKTTGKIKIYEDAHYNLDFPEEFPLNLAKKMVS
jgi:PBP1b-binding outer membrane lipoprotein LpoB